MIKTVFRLVVIILAVGIFFGDGANWLCQYAVSGP